MTSVNTYLASMVAQAPAENTQTRPSQPVQPESSGNGFGNAVNISLSAPAQALVAKGTPAADASSDSSSAPASGAASGNKPTQPTGAAPVGIPPSGNADETTLVGEAKQKVIPKVGVSGAGKVVDAKGNIDETKVNQLVAQQEAQQAAKQNKGE